MIHLRKKMGQSMAEYAVVLTVVIAAIVAMQLYMKRSLQGKIRDVSDNVGFGLLNAGYTKVTNQYEPYYESSAYTVNQDQAIQEQYQATGTVARNSINEKTARTGTQNTGVDQAQGAAWQ
jgi:hypothetical protein